MKSSESEIRRKMEKKAEREKEELIATYEVKQDSLRGEIERFHQQLEQKTADESGRSGLKSLFGNDYLEIDINDYKDDVHIGVGGGGGGGTTNIDDIDDDDDGNVMITGGRTNNTENFFEDDEEQELNSSDNAHIKYLHKHLHRHDHKHIHDHRHTHIHDQTGDKPITYTHSHTIAHTITHTMTQFKIKKNTFGL
eukprot:750144_1